MTSKRTKEARKLTKGITFEDANVDYPLFEKFDDAIKEGLHSTIIGLDSTVTSIDEAVLCERKIVDKYGRVFLDKLNKITCGDINEDILVIVEGYINDNSIEEFMELPDSSFY